MTQVSDSTVPTATTAATAPAVKQPAVPESVPAPPSVPQSTPAPFTPPPQSIPSVSASVGGGKEQEAVSVQPEFSIAAASPEIVLPKEIQDAGVRTQPTTVDIPPPLQTIPVAAQAATVTPPERTDIQLPLNDDQIASGLGMDVTSSFRWFAEWCRRKLLQAHVAVKIIHGRLVRMPMQKE